MPKRRITSVYTKTGDQGETSLVSGERVSKSSVRVFAYGDVDELNSVIGVAISNIKEKELRDILKEIQNHLFILGGDLATPLNNEVEVPRVTEKMVQGIEELIDKFVDETGQLKEFILPEGKFGAPYIHHARGVCRRAERQIVKLKSEEVINETSLEYLNRLSDLLFVMARVENKRAGYNETYVDFKK